MPSALITDYQGEYLWMPRPENPIPSQLINFYRKRGYIGQIKKNGTCTEIIVSPEKQISTWTRHKEPHKAWIPNQTLSSMRRFQDLPEGWFVFAAELLHSKTPHIKDTLYVFDILVANSKQLIGETFIRRQSLLHGLWPVIDDSHYDYAMVDERLWLSKPLIQENLELVFKRLTAPEDEGIVLKDPHATLQMCNNASTNQSWQVKCRKPTKNYSK